MVLQDVVSLKWRVKGIIIEGRISEDGTVRSYLVKKENGKTTIRSARQIKFAERKENLRVRFEESISNEVSDDSGNEASLDSANNGMDTGNDSEASDESIGSMEAESPAHRTRARTSAAVGWRGSY